MPYEVRRRFLEAPTRKETIIFGGLGIFAMLALMAFMTDYGRQSPFRKESGAFWMSLVSVTIPTATLFNNRYRTIHKP
jgi:hypothetical protein